MSIAVKVRVSADESIPKGTVRVGGAKLVKDDPLTLWEEIHVREVAAHPDEVEGFRDQIREDGGFELVP